MVDGEDHLTEVVCDRSHRGKVRVPDSMVVTSVRLVEQDDDSCVNAQHRLVACAAVEAGRTQTSLA